MGVDWIRDICTMHELSLHSLSVKHYSEPRDESTQAFPNLVKVRDFFVLADVLYCTVQYCTHMYTKVFVQYTLTPPKKSEFHRSFGPEMLLFHDKF